MLERMMDELFKQNLLSFRDDYVPQTFAEALFGKLEKLTKDSALKAAPVKETFSEKSQVIESLERFAQEKLANSEKNIIKIPGGEIAQRPRPSWEGISNFSNLNELLGELSLDQKTLNICFEKKCPSEVRVLFVSEAFRSPEEYAANSAQGLLSLFLPAFPTKTAELFVRMVMAMKLLENEVLIYPSIYHGVDISTEVMKVAAYFKPEVIITLGANATQKILKAQDRLAQVHGQFFYRKIEDIGNFLIVPLFHPSIIENNQNMKKTAWTDMQKIMQHLKKI